MCKSLCALDRLLVGLPDVFSVADARGSRDALRETLVSRPRTVTARLGAACSERDEADAHEWLSARCGGSGAASSTGRKTSAYLGYMGVCMREIISST